MLSIEFCSLRESSPEPEDPPSANIACFLGAVVLEGVVFSTSAVGIEDGADNKGIDR